MKITNALFIGYIFILTNCSKPENSKMYFSDITDLKQINFQQWDELSQKRIFFAHQSVGFNILDGVNQQLSLYPQIKLKIIESKDPNTFNTPVFAHARNGQNGDPISKIDDFVEAIDSGLGHKVDFAGFKFCYVDFKKATDVHTVFEYYIDKMTYLKRKYPEIKFIHFSVPLRTLQQGPKGFINKLLGREYGLSDNSARQKFNTLLKDKFGNEPIFDIAFFESTYPSGRRNYSNAGGEIIYTMIPELSNDGGHLSEIGKNKLSQELLIFLVNLCKNA